VLDLKDFTVKGTIDLVSGGKAFAKTMLAAAATGAVAGAGSAAAGVPIAPVMVPMGSGPQYSSSLVDPSGEVVYILGPGHLHVADLKTYKKISSIGLGFFPSYAFFSPTAPGQNPVLFVVGIDVGFVSRSYRMAAISTATKEKLLDQKWLAPCAYTADRKYAVNFDSNSVYLMDASTLSVTKTIGGFKELHQLLLVPPQ